MLPNAQHNGHANTDQVHISESLIEPDINTMNTTEIPSQKRSIHSTLVEVHTQLEDLLNEMPEQANKFEIALHRISRYLDIERPFKVAIVAATGTGKSTLLNAMLARDLVLVKNMGGAATGCALYLHQDVSETEVETATVFYRDEADIRALILKHFIEAYHLDDAVLPELLDDGFAAMLEQVQPNSSLSENEYKTFDELRKTLVELVQQYAKRSESAQGTEVFSLESKEDRARLLSLIDEGSAQNQGARRKIGLVKSVEYHVKAGSDDKLKLPENVCLVDLPGLDGTCLHNIIIKEGIEDADAVLFLVHPRRFENLSNTELLKRVKRFVSSDHDPRSAERIFWVVNAKDDVTEEMQQVLPKIEFAVHKFLEKTIPGSTQYAQQFIISAWAALQSQKALRGELLENVDKYAGIQRTLGIEEGDHKATLAESYVPSLVDALNKFVKVTAERQVRSAQQELRYIAKDLIVELEAQQQEFTEGVDSARYQSRKVRKILHEKQKKAEEILQDFRSTQISAQSGLLQQLHRASDALCDEIDESLRTKMPQYWRENFHGGVYVPDVTRVASVNRDPFLGQVEVHLWRLADNKINRLAQVIVRSYEEAIVRSGLTIEVAKLSTQQIEQTLLAQTIQAEIELTGRRLSDAARGLALCHLVNPENRFLPSARDVNSAVLTVLQESVPFTKELDPSDFDEFIQAVRSHYDEIIQRDCIGNLLDLYLYEMIRIEEKLIAFLHDQFDDLRYSGKVTVSDLVREQGECAEWQMMNNVENQLDRLRLLQTQIATIA